MSNISGKARWPSKKENNKSKIRWCGVTVDQRVLPTAVIPEIAFVTDMSGECKAGVTPQTV